MKLEYLAEINDVNVLTKLCDDRMTKSLDIHASTDKEHNDQTFKSFVHRKCKITKEGSEKKQKDLV